MKHRIITAVAAGSIAALMSTTAIAQTAGPGYATPTSASVQSCADTALLASRDGMFVILNKDVDWRDPIPALQRDGRWVLPNDKTVDAPAGYTVLVRLADKCPLRFTYKVQAPDTQVSGGTFKW